MTFLGFFVCICSYLNDLISIALEGEGRVLFKYENRLSGENLLTVESAELLDRPGI